MGGGFFRLSFALWTAIRANSTSLGGEAELEVESVPGTTDKVMLRVIISPPSCTHTYSTHAHTHTHIRVPFILKPDPLCVGYAPTVLGSTLHIIYVIIVSNNTVKIL